MGTLSDSWPCPTSFRFHSRIIAAILAALFLAACGGGKQSGPTASSPGTGTVSFSAVFEAPPNSRGATSLPAAGEPPAASPLALAPLAAAINVCEDHGLEWIDLAVIRRVGQTDNVIRENRSIPCTDNQGTVGDVPAASGYYLRIEGRGLTGGAIYRGYSDCTFMIVANTNTNVGQVSVDYVGNDNTAPTVLQTIPLVDPLREIMDNSAIGITFSEKMAINTLRNDVVIDNNAHVVNYTASKNGVSDNVYTFSPVTSWPPGRTSFILDNVTDMAMNKMQGGSFDFNVHPDGLFGNNDPSSPFYHLNYVALSAPGEDVVYNSVRFRSEKGHNLLIYRYALSGGRGVKLLSFNQQAIRWEAEDPSIPDLMVNNVPYVNNMGNYVVAWDNGSDIFYKKKSGGLWGGSNRITSGTGIIDIMNYKDNNILFYRSGNTFYGVAFDGTSGDWSGVNCNGGFSIKNSANDNLFYACLNDNSLSIGNFYTISNARGISVYRTSTTISNNALYFDSCGKGVIWKESDGAIKTNIGGNVSTIGYGGASSFPVKMASDLGGNVFLAWIGSDLLRHYRMYRDGIVVHENLVPNHVARTSENMYLRAVGGDAILYFDKGYQELSLKFNGTGILSPDVDFGFGSGLEVCGDSSTKCSMYLDGNGIYHRFQIPYITGIGFRLNWQWDK